MKYTTLFKIVCCFLLPYQVYAANKTYEVYDAPPVCPECKSNYGTKTVTRGSGYGAGGSGNANSAGRNRGLSYSGYNSGLGGGIGGIGWGGSGSGANALGQEIQRVNSSMFYFKSDTRLDNEQKKLLLGIIGRYEKGLSLSVTVYITSLNATLSKTMQKNISSFFKNHGPKVKVSYKIIKPVNALTKSNIVKFVELIKEYQ